MIFYLPMTENISIIIILIFDKINVNIMYVETEGFRVGRGVHKV